MRTCGATPGGPSLDGVDLKTQTVIQGVILKAGVEDSTNLEGKFRFFAAPGTWTLVVQAPGARVEQQVVAAQGVPVDHVIHI
jgi:hypothetical protein